MTGFFNAFDNEQDIRNDVGQPGRISDGKPQRFYIESKRNHIFAECDVYSEKRIVVRSGSTAAKREIKGFPNWLKMKERLVADGVLVDEGQLYRFAKDHEFRSPSAAGAIVLSTSVNGRRNLKDSNGIPFDTYYRK